MFKKVLFLLMLLSFFSSCVTTNTGQAVKECRTTDCLRRTLGPPTYKIPNKQAGEIWLYSETWTETSPGRIHVNGNTATYTLPSEHKAAEYVKFWVKNNRVYRWESHGKDLRKLSTAGFVLTFLGTFGGGLWLLLSLDL